MPHAPCGQRGRGCQGRLTTILGFSESRYAIQEEWEGTHECGGGATRGDRDFHVRQFLLVVARHTLTSIPLHRKDILVVVDKHLQEKKGATKGATVKTAELLKAAGCVGVQLHSRKDLLIPILVRSTDAIVVVTTSLVDAQAQIERSSPQLKASLLTHSKDVVIVIDKSLKNPLVITGVTKFAKSQGVPHPEALLRVASLALNKLLVIIHEEEGKAKEEVEKIKSAEEAKLRSAAAGSDAVIVEYDAEELQRTATEEAQEEAGKIGKIAEGAQQPTVQLPKVQQPKGQEPKGQEPNAQDQQEQPEASTSKGKGKEKEKDDKCIIM